MTHTLVYRLNTFDGEKAGHFIDTYTVQSTLTIRLGFCIY